MDLELPKGKSLLDSFNDSWNVNILPRYPHMQNQQPTLIAGSEPVH
jgi:hypothetical protein